ncbi:pyruvate kinase [Methyloligella sp. 2.7D]|uniref:pyruvate kinase n=1 Tax=unclassified Methyloligella TaxID=2625955 RepID=UPI00157D23EB|nr:pyruvate kinase [Methyloligella sp. GL2]QKP76780.1 pyruvate kinase [Methyloligella sp. GL2]
MRRNRRVKIVATLGPVSNNEQAMRRLFEAGADVFRINMSHTSHESMTETQATIRKLEEEFARPIGILCDLQGPKLRIGKFESGAMRLNEGDVVSFVRREVTDGSGRIHLPHPEIFEAIEAGHTLLLDDGKLKLRVVEASDVRIDAEVLVGGSLGSRKGVSLPDTVLPMGAMTDKDRADLEHACSVGVDWIALSFVQRAQDITDAKALVKDRAAVMAKIEKPSAVTDLADILELTDGIMVARGDLGVEMPVEKVPGIQKQITRAARNAGKPVVVATQMLESMIEAPVPTRAEVSDVATAVFEGADAVMLSAESAVGKFPYEAVATMDRVAIEVERDPLYEAISHAQNIYREATGIDAVSAAARTVASTLSLAAIVCYTSSGNTSMRAARERPDQPILALTPVPATGRKLAIVWGLHCVLTGDPKDLDDMVDKACRIALEEGFARPDDKVIISAGLPFGKSGGTNMLRIASVEDGSHIGA